MTILKPGSTNFQFNELVCNIAKKYSVTPIQGAISYQISQNSLDCLKQIPINLSASEQAMLTELRFLPNEIYVIDIAFSTGDGKIRTRPELYKTNIYRKMPGNSYQFKFATSRSIFGEISKNFKNFPFHLRNTRDMKKTRMGLYECVKHTSVTPSDVLIEKENESVARFMYTVMISNDTNNNNEPILLCSSF